MNAYTETLTLTLPYSVEMADIAARIARAMDPDVGGECSFSRTVTGYEGEAPVYGDTLVCRTPCTADFKAQALAMLGNSAMLHYAVTADYAARWPELTPPTLAECEAFVTELGAQ
jgi:hypothetical protein